MSASDTLIDDIGAALAAEALANPAVAEIAEGRGYPSELPQNERRPSFTYEVISDVAEHHLTGAAGLSQARVEITCYAPTRRQANELRNRIRKALQGRQFTRDGVSVRQVHKENANTFYERDPAGGDNARHGAMIDLLADYHETIP